MHWKSPLRPVERRWRERRRPSLSPDLLGEPARVHIGAGDRELPGWVNTDLSTQVRLDLLVPWPVPAGSVDYVYGDNVIEHFTIDESRAVLRHAAAAMRPGGTIRLCTPDVERVAKAYLEDGDDLERMLARHRRHGYTVEHPVDALRVVFCESGHHLGYLFDPRSLTEELHRAGFVDVRYCELGASSDPVLVGLEHRTEAGDEVYQLVVEADRGPRP